MSCLFECIAKHMKLPSSEYTRKEICDYLIQGLPILDGMQTADILSMEDPQYVQKMRKSETPGGAIEIQVAANIWRIHVVVNGRNDKPPMEFKPLDENGSSIMRLYWSGGHYELQTPTI